MSVQGQSSGLGRFMWGGWWYLWPAHAVSFAVTFLFWFSRGEVGESTAPAAGYLAVVIPAAVTALITGAISRRLRAGGTGRDLWIAAAGAAIVAAGTWWTILYLGDLGCSFGATGCYPTTTARVVILISLQVGLLIHPLVSGAFERRNEAGRSS